MCLFDWWHSMLALSERWWAQPFPEVTAASSGWTLWHLFPPSLIFFIRQLPPNWINLFPTGQFRGLSSNPSLPPDLSLLSQHSLLILLIAWTLIVNICVWDAQFFTCCQDSELLWALNYPTPSPFQPSSLHFLQSVLVISWYAHGYSLHRARTCRHKHVSHTSAWHPGNLSSCSTWRDNRAELGTRSLQEDAPFSLKHTWAKTKVVMSKYNKTT